MGEQTAIAWTDHTFNPWWGCTRVSPGCEHCYAEAFAKLRDQCASHGVPFFFKQVGGRTPTAGGDELDGETIKQFPAVTL